MLDSNSSNRIDLLESSCELSKPRFPCFWDVEVNVFLDSGIYGGICKRPPGRGFFNIPGDLPPSAVTAFTDLALVDLMMTRHNYAPRESFVPMLLAARNASIHRLLCVPAWEDLKGFEKERTDLIAYEVCRVTAILYSNAVLLGIPPHNGWHKMFIERLRILLEVSKCTTWAEDVSGFWVWALFVGGITSYRSPHRSFFKNALHELLLSLGLPSWQSVRSRLQEFLWSDAACEHGAIVLWDTLGLDEH